MDAVVLLLLKVLQIYSWVVIAAVVASWLVNFNAVNVHNQLVRQIVGFLYAVTEPVFRPIRQVIPAIGGLDLSPLIVLLGIWFLQNLLIGAL